MKGGEIGWACNTNGSEEYSYKSFAGKSKWKRPLGRHKFRLEDNIKIDLYNFQYKGVYWINQAQDRNL
jgi:hypothetical protein